MSSVMEIAMKEMGHLIELAKANLKVLPGPIVNVSGYGAVGDGVTNDTIVVQSAIDYAILNGMKAVFFPRGTNGQYYVTTLTNANQVVFFGDNASFVGGYTGEILQLGEGGVTQAEFDALEAETVSDIVNAVTGHGADPTGVSNSTAALQAAINAAAGKKLYIPSGTYLVDSLAGISNIVIEGAGRDLVVFKRKDNAVGSLPIIEFNGKTKFEIRGITFDGNKAIQTTGSNSLSLVGCGNYVIEDNRFINGKFVSGYGSGIAIIGGTNDSDGTTSLIENNWLSDNESDGLYLNKEWNIAVRGNTFKNNGAAGMNVLNNVYPPVSDVSDGLIISKNYAIGNTGTGITVSGYVIGGSASAPIFGATVPPSRRIVVEGNMCTDNGSYGIAYQGTNGNVIGNVCERNSRIVNYAGGILFNADNSVCIGNCTRDNKSYGIDAGGSFHCIIANNQVQAEGESNNTSATYINIGASAACVVEANIIRMAGSQQHTGIAYPGIDGDGNTPFPVVGGGSVIKNNMISVNAHAMTAGIYVGRLAGAVSIMGNFLRNITDLNRAIICEIFNVQMKDNNIQVSGTFIPSFASAATMIIPDYAETIYVTGTTNITKIYTYSQNVFDGKVRDVSITNQGSGYSPSSLPTVSFSGGGGSGAAATAEVDNGGRVVGVVMTNNGSGYTSAPTVTISGGVGTGAAGTALIGLNNFEGREISLLFQGALTVTDGASLNLVGNLVAGTNNTVLKLRGAYGNWYEVSRAIT